MATGNLKQIHIIPSETSDNRKLVSVENVGGTHILLKMTQSGCQFLQPTANITTAFVFHLLGFKQFCPFCLDKDCGGTWGMIDCHMAKLMPMKEQVMETQEPGNHSVLGLFT